MTIRTLRKWMIFLAVTLGIFLGGWISLEFLLVLDEMREYAIIFRFWSGIRDACVFICFLLSALWLFVFFYSIFFAIRDEVTAPVEPEVPTEPAPVKTPKPKKSKRSANTAHNKRKADTDNDAFLISDLDDIDDT